MKTKYLSKSLFIALLMGGTLLGVSNIQTHASTKQHWSANQNYYMKTAPKYIKTIKSLNIYNDPQRQHKDYSVTPGYYYGIKRTVPQWRDLETTGHKYLTSNKHWVQANNGYQNPKRYYQVSYKPVTGASYIPSVGVGYEGMRTYMFTHRYGLPDYHNYFTYGDRNYIRWYQHRHHLEPTGRLNYSTWRRMEFSKYSWYHLDNDTPNTSFKPTDSRWTHINTGLKRARQYLGGIWISGTSSSPYYKKADCSGLAMQYLMAGGLKSKYTPMYHSTPGNEWDSTKMWSDPKLKWIPFSQRERGDLIFFAPSYGSSVWHVGILTSRNYMIDSWPPVVQYHSIYNAEHGVIVGVKRPFI